MSAVGTWNLEINTPRGTQTPTLTISEGADGLTGEVAGQMGTMNLKDLAEDGNSLTFNADFNRPAGEMKLKFSATIDGDSLSGEVALGEMGTSQITGTRA